MKTIKILIASLILVVQSYAFSKSERNLLLGLSASAILAYALEANDIKRVHHNKIVYVDSYNHGRKGKQYVRSHHHKHYGHHGHHKYHRKHHKHHGRYESRHERKKPHYDKVAYNHRKNSHHYRY